MRANQMMHATLGVFLALAAGALIGSTAPPPTAWAHTQRHGPIIVRERHGKNQVDSTNWSGYAVTGTSDSVTDAKGSWVVPAVDCKSTPNAYASFWVGIDGYDSSTVEQTGTDSDCEGGVATYYAWFEFYPHFSYTVNSLTVVPGDVISADVNYGAKGQFTVSITVNPASHPQTFSTSTKLNQAKRSSAEWIIEAPYSGGVLPLADFNSVSFGADSTGVASTCDAAVGKTSGAIGSFTGDVVAITMVSDTGVPKSAPSGLSTDKSSFTDAWYHAGP
jgi:hypothetical protein